jgi:HEAT repeat protein/PBS lyase HEAT-like repeat-containing protein
MLDDVFKEAPVHPPEPARPPERKRSQFLAPPFLIPVLLLLLLLFIVYFFGLLSFDAKSPADLLAEVRTSAGEKRAVAAFELSRLGSLELPARARAAFVSDAVRTFEEESGKDLRVRRALALILGRLGDRRAVPALLGALEDPDVETQLYVIWALGAIGQPGPAGPLLSRLQHDDAGIRKMAAFSLGQIGDPKAVPALKAALQDPAPDVGWNAAIALARLGDRSALPVLLPLLASRRPPPGLTPAQEVDLKINIIRSLRGMAGEPAASTLRAVASGDPSPRIRSEARALLAGGSESPPLSPSRAP